MTPAIIAIASSERQYRQYQVVQDLLFPGLGFHESACVVDPVEIGVGTRISYLGYVLGHVRIGALVSIGQNMVIGLRMSVGANFKI